jgi:hypothetical protein
VNLTCGQNVTPILGWGKQEQFIFDDFSIGSRVCFLPLGFFVLPLTKKFGFYKPNFFLP